MISKKVPKGFKPDFEVAACYCINNGKILFLKRHQEKPYGGLWNLPAGKIELGETPIEGVLREVFEETGNRLKANELKEVGKYAVIYPEYNYFFYTFKAEVGQIDVKLKPDESTEFEWFTPHEALKIHTVPDEDFCIKDAFKIA